MEPIPVAARAVAPAAAGDIEMKLTRMKTHPCVALALFGLSAAANAAMFGAVELGGARDSNFNGSETAAGAISETWQSLSASLGWYTPVNARTALVFRGGAQNSRFDQADYLDGNIFSLNTGAYYSFDRRNSLSGALGARFKRFEDSRRDGSVLSVSVDLKQKSSPVFWLSEAAFYEKGTAETPSGEYSGYGLNVGLNWKPAPALLLTAGAGAIQRTYNVTVGNKRTGYQFNAGVSWVLTKNFYFQGRAGWQLNSDDSGREYQGNTYSIASGINF